MLADSDLLKSQAAKLALRHCHPQATPSHRSRALMPTPISPSSSAQSFLDFEANFSSEGTNIVPPQQKGMSQMFKFLRGETETATPRPSRVPPPPPRPQTLHADSLYDVSKGASSPHRRIETPHVTVERPAPSALELRLQQVQQTFERLSSPARPARAAPIPLASPPPFQIYQPSVLHVNAPATPTSEKGVSVSPPTVEKPQQTPLQSLASAKATMDMTAREEKGIIGARKLDSAVTGRLLELERQLTSHQNEHVRRRAAISVMVDKARYESDQSMFRQSDLEERLADLVQSLRQRISSRFDTMHQLQDDSKRRLERRIETELKNTKALFGKEARDHRSPALDDCLGLKRAIDQGTAHFDVQTCSLEAKFLENWKIIAERIKGVLHVLDNHPASTQRDAIQSMHVMMETFAKQIRAEIAALRDERIAYEASCVSRLHKIVPREYFDTLQLSPQ